MSSQDTIEQLNTSRPDPIEAKRQEPLRSPQNQFHPLKLFTDNAWAARVWFLLCLALLTFIIIQPYLLINAYRTRERVVILDGSGTYSIAPTLDFEEATHLHEELALWSTYALYSQNPNGFDMPELLDKVFLEEALRKARSLHSDLTQEFREKNIHQKVEVFEIKILQTRSEQIIAQVNGQLIRTGNFEGKAFIEDPEFSLTLVMHRNPNMLINKRFPLAVLSFEESVTL